jgi:hypothetical protein
MDRQEILKKAKAKLPDVYKWEMDMIAIPVVKDLPLVVNNETLPKKSGYYEVRFEKILDLNSKVIWRLIDIYDN